MDPLSRLIGVAYLVQIVLFCMQALLVALLLASGIANLFFAKSANQWLRRARLLRDLPRQEARGFGASRRRTWARPSVFRSRDWAALGVAAVVAGAAIAAAVASGSWNAPLS